jgi:D-3-phosphoglycerate dehydrogenase
MKAFLEHGNIRNSVNFPEAHLARSGTRRLTITNRNVPKMVHQITNVLADTNINISDMLNKHRGGIAYNIIDVDSDVDPSLLKKIEAIDGVLAVRYLN